MIGLLAAIPAIFDAISGVSSLADKGMSVYREVTGEAPPTADTLQDAVAALPDEQKAQWAEKMKAEVEAYEAQTKRLIAEQGSVDAETLSTLTPEARDKIAVSRMTVRPWTVRVLVIGLVGPMFFIYSVDGALVFLNVIMAALGVTVGAGDAAVLVQFKLVGDTLAKEGSIYSQMYSTYTPWAAGLVGSYMTLREVGKAGGPKQVASATVGASLNAIKKLFTK